VYNVTGRARNAAPVATRRALGLFSRTYILRAPTHGTGIRLRVAAAFPAHGGMLFRLKARKLFGGERNLYFRSGFLSPPNPHSLPAPLRAAALRTRKAVADRLSSPDKYAFCIPNSLPALNKHEFGTTNSISALDKHEFGATNSFSAPDKHEFGAQNALPAFDKHEFGAQDESAGFPARTPTYPETTAAYAAAEQYGKGAFL
ncbi:MAG: hypothetical protein K2O09_08550, partial [Treponemataceae bacterium]|nr:hypothetical protein [Treponemataceae bacterium]